MLPCSVSPEEELGFLYTTSLTSSGSEWFGVRFSAYETVFPS